LCSAVFTFQGYCASVCPSAYRANCCDVKPDNILLDAEGHAHLADFNVASYLQPKRKLTGKSGTPGYMGCTLSNAANSSPGGIQWSRLRYVTRLVLPRHDLLRMYLRPSAFRRQNRHSKPTNPIPRYPLSNYLSPSLQSVCPRDDQSPGARSERPSRSKQLDKFHRAPLFPGPRFPTSRNQETAAGVSPVAREEQF
jgi:hypothetical protein